MSAYQRFETLYIEQRYQGKPSTLEVSEQVSGIIRGILGQHGGSDIVDNPMIQSHFIVCRGKHLNRVPNQLSLMAGLTVAAATNLVHRSSIGWHFDRVVFSCSENGPFHQLSDIPTEYTPLAETNINDVLLATGSIPLVLAPVEHIPPLEPSRYYDGGITDYHFDLKLNAPTGLTLYPHFHSQITPGWFDKGLKWRRAHHNYSNALILAPSAEFVASLPYGKIPDRTDFSKMETSQRIAYWKRVSQQSDVLAEELDNMITADDITQWLEPM